MKRIGFLLNVNKEWLGGVNYYRNLFWALHEYASDGWETVVFVPEPYNLDIIKDYPPSIKIVRSSVLSRWSCAGVARRVIRRLFKNDFLLKWCLDRHGVRIVSHVSTDLFCGDIKTIAWIPDFQHIYLPEFFSKGELVARDRTFLNLAKNADVVLLSSNAAKSDFMKFCPKYKEKAEVLHFVPKMECENIPDLQTLCSKYSIPQKFFYLPNQYWIHKNHKIVLQALKLLRDEGKKVFVVSTGQTGDYRAPRLMDEIRKYIQENRLQEMYCILGSISYIDTRGLSIHCQAYINPSLFEGWSTTVEEAKCYGKLILLSDIPVHREQAPERGVFFDPSDACQLAAKMWSMWNAPNVPCDLEALLKTNQKKRKAFAERYCQIIESVGNKF